MINAPSTTQVSMRRPRNENLASPYPPIAHASVASELVTLARKNEFNIARAIGNSVKSRRKFVSVRRSQAMPNSPSPRGRKNEVKKSFWFLIDDVSIQQNGINVSAAKKTSVA